MDSEMMMTSTMTSAISENVTASSLPSDDYFTFLLYEVTVPILYGVVTVLGVIGNSLVIYVIVSKERMRTVTNFLLLNLAIADLSFVVVIPPSTAYVFAANRWPFGDVACRLMHYLINVTAYVTVYTLVLISVIRYMTIVHTTSTARYRTTSRVVTTIVAIWVLMMVVNTPVLIKYRAVVDDLTGTWVCMIASDLAARQLYATFFAFAYLVPLTVIAIFSVGILRHIMRHKAPMTSSVTSTSALSSSCNAAVAGGRKRSRSDDKKRQAGRTLVLVVVMFAVLWLPVHIHLLVMYFGKIPDTRFYEAVSVLWNCLAYFNSCVNPIIYNRTSKEFRDAFLEVCGCQGRRDRSNSTDLVVADGRRVSLVTHLTPNNRHHVSCTTTYFPSPSASLLPSPGPMQKSATASDDLSPASPSADTVLQVPECDKSNTLAVPTTSEPN